MLSGKNIGFSNFAWLVVSVSLPKSPCYHACPESVVVKKSVAALLECVGKFVQKRRR
jgi:hypothetical protein